MQKLQNFSLNLFLFLFGFFCGNLLPGGSSEFSWNSEQLQTTETKSSWTQSNLETEVGNTIFDLSSFKNSPNPTEFSLKSPGDLFTLDTSSRPKLQTFFSALPGPGFFGLIVLLLAEFINWCGWVAFASRKAQTSVQNENIGKRKSPTRLDFWKKGSLARDQFSLQNPFKFSSLNSFKIGFLLGIFVDAFKVGS